MSTGYANQTFNILNILSDAGYEVHQLAANAVYNGHIIPPNGLTLEDGTTLKYRLHPTGMHQHGQQMLQPLIQHLKPDFFCVLLDLFMTYNWMLNVQFAPARSGFYFPSDGGGGLPNECESILKKVDFPIAMSKFGQEQAKTVHNVDVDYIPHGVDTEIFFSMAEKEKNDLRMKHGLVGKFVVGMVTRNQGRKMIDVALKAFAKFAEKNPDAMLFMHTDPDDQAQAFSLKHLINRLQIQNRVAFTGMSYIRSFSYKQMNEVYNLMDVYFSTTSGEGFGIPTIEAMACSVPVIITDYTTSKEVVIDNGVCGVTFPLLTEITGSWTVDRGIPDCDGAVLALQKLHDDIDLRSNMGRVGKDKIDRIYSWKVVGELWKTKIAKILET